MIKDFILPDIGEGIVECEIVEWLVKEGDLINEDQLVVEIMTDKAVVEIPSINHGKVVKHYYQQGEMAIVHTPLFSIEIEESEESPASSPAKPKLDKKIPLESSPPTEIIQPVLSKEINDHSDPSLNKKVLTTPAIRRIARELNIDLKEVPGSGKNGRILKTDLESFKQYDAPSFPQPPPLPNSNKIEPLKGIKLLMAKAMTLSAFTIPHFNYGDEVDVSDLVNLRDSLKQSLEKEDVKLTLMPFFLKSLALAIQEFPIMNSRLNSEVTEIHYQSNINIGFAVNSKIGLLVPNIKNVETLSILEITKELNRLTKAARDGKLRPEDIKGGTITISNIGSIGGTFASPLISVPEVAIIALGKIQSLPRFNEKNEVVARKIMQISWAGDHRIIDGGTMAQCSNLWMDFIENPSKMLLNMR